MNFLEKSLVILSIIQAKGKTILEVVCIALNQLQLSKAVGRCAQPSSDVVVIVSYRDRNFKNANIGLAMPPEVRGSPVYGRLIPTVYVQRVKLNKPLHQ